MNKFFSHIKQILLIQIFIIISFFVYFNANSDESSKNFNSIYIGDDNAPVEIKIYSSLTCPHCANFHLKVVTKIEEKYVKSGKVKIVFIDFPLDIAALNAAKILHCVEKDNQMNILDLIYKKQSKWATGTTIEEVNEKLKQITTTSGINPEKIDKCFADENIENKVLSARIEGHKKYSINSTPTIIINEKKFTGTQSFEDIEKIIKKNI